MRVLTLFAGVLGAVAQPMPEGLLDRVRASAMRYEGRLPDFTSTKVTTRKQLAGSAWKTKDTLEEVVSFAANGRASYKLMKLNGREVKRGRPHGLIEDALLGDAIVPSSVFGAGARAQFRFDGWETRDGRRVAVLGYTGVGVNYPDGKRRYELQVTGRVFFDEAAGNLVRIESTKTGPAGYPLGETLMEIDYAPVTLAGRELVLPAHAVIETSAGRRRLRNEMTFTAYRKYEAEATIRFEDPQ